MENLKGYYFYDGNIKVLGKIKSLITGTDGEPILPELYDFVLSQLHEQEELYTLAVKKYNLKKEEKENAAIEKRKRDLAILPEIAGEEDRDTILEIMESLDSNLSERTKHRLNWTLDNYLFAYRIELKEYNDNL